MCMRFSWFFFGIVMVFEADHELDFPSTATIGQSLTEGLP